MKLQKSKFLSIFLAVTLIATIFNFGITASAASWSYYTFDDGTYSLFKYTDSASEIDLSQIKNADKYIGIESEAFAECTNLKVIHIPENFYTIKDYAVGYIRNGSRLSKVSNFTIKAKTNSAAHEYAVSNGFNFISTGTAKPDTEHSIIPDENGYCSSGLKKFSKLTKKEIAQLVKDPYVANADSPYITEPSAFSPYSLGSVRTEILNSGLIRLNAYRRLSGLDSVTLNSDYNQKAQTASLVNAANNIMTHYPTKPVGMSDDLYQVGYETAGRSNLAYYMGYTTKSGPIAFSVDLWMDDSDSHNIAVLGHRRWFLNPTMGQTGFGCANHNASVHTTAYAFDHSTPVSDYDFISWPPSGNVPNNTDFFTPAHAWSVSLNPSKINTWDLSSVTVELTRESDGKKWIFDNVNNSSGGFFNVDTNGYGVSNCIIFRPDNIDYYDGIFTVKINGLKSLSGNNTTSMSFRVDFFDTTHFSEETTTQSTTESTTETTTATTTETTTETTTATTTEPTTEHTTVTTTETTTETTTATTTESTAETSTIPQEKPQFLGDVNGDGKITAADARLALQFAARLQVPTETQAFVANVIKDDRITAADARLILRVSARLDTLD